MVTKIFIDTNILIDLFDESRIHHSAAIKLFDALEKKEHQGFVSESVLNTTAYLLRKSHSISKIKTIFKDFLFFIKLLEVDTSTYNKALLIAVIDIEDAVLYATAIEHKLNFFVTSNTKDFKKIEQKQLPIISSTDFVKIYL